MRVSISSTPSLQHLQSFHICSSCMIRVCILALSCFPGNAGHMKIWNMIFICFQYNTRWSTGQPEKYESCIRLRPSPNRLANQTLYQILCSIWSHLAFLLLNPVWQPTRFCIMYSGKRMKACVALQNGWIYPRIISLCLSTSQQCLHKHGSFKSTDRGKWVQYTKSWFGRWCLQSDGHRWGALSSADVSSNRESGSFVRDIFINCYRWDMIRFWTCQRGCYQHQWGRLCDLILVLNGISLLHACHTQFMDNVVHVSHMLQSG